MRRWVARDRHDRRGRKTDFVWAHRLLLLGGYDTLSMRGRTRLNEIFTADDPTHGISAAWGLKEQLRRLLACTTLPGARAERVRFNQHVTLTAMTETTRLKKTIDVWWNESETFITTRATKPETEAANVTIKNINAPDAATARTTTTHAGSCSTTPPEEPPKRRIPVPCRSTATRCCLPPR